MSPELIAGRYRVVRPIGRGGMGTVWLCHDDMLGREVAVKQIGTLPGESAPVAARALREARSAAALNHRNVVSVFDIVDAGDAGDAGEDAGGHAWLVMEYVPSRTLAQIVREDGPMDPRRAARIGAQVADGLAAAHAAGIVHRDVKPGNVLVTDGDVAKISDFGIARGAGDDQLTRTGLVTGTPSYFSPELARGDDPGQGSDIYALGATLYYAVEGRAPYPEHRNAIALLQTIATQDPEPPRHAGALAGPIARMMAREPHARGGAADAATALHRLADGEAGDDTAVLSRDDAPTRATPAAGAAAAGAAAGAGAGAAARGGDGDTADAGETPTAATPVEPRPAEPRPAEPRPAAPAPAAASSGTAPRRRGGMAPWLAAAAVLMLVLLGVGYLAVNAEQDGRDRSTAGAPSPSPSTPSRERSSSPSPKPEPKPEPTTQEPTPTPTPAPQEGSASQLESRVTEYFGIVPANTDEGWDRLAPSMQQQGRAAYDDWWGSIDDVRLHSADAVDGQDQVRIDLTYFFSDGTAKRETQVLTMQPSDRGYLIADDEVLSSRTVS